MRQGGPGRNAIRTRVAKCTRKVNHRAGFDVGAGNALGEVARLIQGMEDGSTRFETFKEQVTNVAAGVRYGALTETDPDKGAVIDDAFDAVIRLLAAFDSGDGDRFAAEVQKVADAAITMLDACGLE